MKKENENSFLEKRNKKMFSSFFWILFCILLLSVSHSIWNFFKKNKEERNVLMFTKQQKLEMEQQLQEFIAKDVFLENA